MEHTLKRFNVRVYGLLVNPLGQLLVSDEQFANGIRTTKFPGGGLELGEGTKDCIVRELQEEASVNVEVVRHFYTTDFFVPSFLDTTSQVISIYYLLQSDEWQNIKVSDKKFDFTVEPGMEAESFRWVPVAELRNEDTITLPIDKVVVDMLLQEHNLFNERYR